MDGRGLFITLCVVVAVAASCNQPADRAETSAASQSTATTKGVQWPALRQLDELAEQAEQVDQISDLAVLRKLGADIKSAASGVASAAPPTDAQQPQQLRVLQHDLGTLVQSMADPGTMPEADLRQILPGFHPIVEQLMETAGMPHVHEHPEGSATSHASENK